MQAFVDRFRAKATKARQAQSRLKAIARLEPVPDIVEDRIKPFQFPNPAKALSPPLVRFESAVAGYGPEQIVLRGLDLRIDPDDRIGLLGANGNGKSTFAKLLAGRLAPIAGAMRHDRRMGIGYAAQHHIDELNPEHSPYDHVRTLMPDATEAQVRTRVGTIGFGADTADTAAKYLSGGEKTRLLFALTTFHGPNLLILDEPTNHLDIESRQALIQALNDYEGAVILISHDRHLLEATVDRLWLVSNGGVAPYEGDLDTYRDLLLSERRAANRSERKKITREAGTAPNGADAATRRRLGAQKRASLAPLKRAVEAEEQTIEKLRREIAGLDEKLADSSLYESDPEAPALLSKERAERIKAVNAAEERWFAASERLEVATQEIESA